MKAIRDMGREIFVFLFDLSSLSVRYALMVIKSFGGRLKVLGTRKKVILYYTVSLESSKFLRGSRKDAFRYNCSISDNDAPGAVL